MSDSTVFGLFLLLVFLLHVFFLNFLNISVFLLLLDSSGGLHIFLRNASVLTVIVSTSSRSWALWTAGELSQVSFIWRRQMF